MPLDEDEPYGDLEALVPEEFHMAATAMGRGGSGGGERRGGTPIDRYAVVVVWGLGVGCGVYIYIYMFMSDWHSHPPTNSTNSFHIRPSTHACICLCSKELVLEVLPYLCLGAEFLLVGSSAYVTGLRKKVCG